MICGPCSGFNRRKAEVKCQNKEVRTEMSDRDLRKRELNGPGHKMTWGTVEIKIKRGKDLKIDDSCVLITSKCISIWNLYHLIAWVQMKKKKKNMQSIHLSLKLHKLIHKIPKMLREEILWTSLVLYQLRPFLFILPNVLHKLYFM